MTLIIKIAMTKSDFREDILIVLKARDLTIYRLAREAHVDQASLWRFVNNEGGNLTTDSFFNLWDLIYGDQRPQPVLTKIHK